MDIDRDDSRVFMDVFMDGASALRDSANALKQIAKQTRYTYLQGNEYSNTMRIDNRTGEICKLTSQWRTDSGSTTLVWEPESVLERKADAQAERRLAAQMETEPTEPTADELPF